MAVVKIGVTPNGRVRWRAKSTIVPALSVWSKLFMVVVGGEEKESPRSGFSVGRSPQVTNSYAKQSVCYELRVNVSSYRPILPSATVPIAKVSMAHTCGDTPSILRDGGTFRPCGICTWPKSTAKASHHTPKWPSW